ncbi:transporter substrate-binding domain-containing protein [Billgrantia endophytica]|uniref:ABC transporter substrate-binding protein n=1 Tax=Billgrantia endophytica TaxID=2033802 RepID=A0A2N7U7W8_9GAMM|nr:transporter substrate-binding domain-containing protein [Halomonas endophytica]PMR76531.1 ABC transporter substrate-binding protein [Halomonas endophytica]
MSPYNALIGGVTATLLLGFAAQAQSDTLADIRERDVLSVGIKNDYPPYGYLDENNEIVGFEIELVRYIANELLGSPDKVELIPVVASNRIELLNSGRIDLIMATLGVTEERAQVIDFTEHYVSAAGASVLARQEARFDQWEQLEGQNVCGIQGAYYNRTLTDHYGIRLVNFTALPEAYRALQDNRCVAMVFDDMTLRQKLGEPGWEGYKIAVEPYEYLPMAGGVRKGDEAFLDAVNAAIVKAEGEDRLIDWEGEYDMPPSDHIAARAEAARAVAE